MNEAQVTPPDPGARALRVAVVLALLLITGAVGVLLARARHDPEALPPPPAPFLPAPSAVVAPPPATVPPPIAGRTPGTTAPASADPPDATSRPTSASRARPPATRTRPQPPRAEITGTYRVVESFGDGFIGEVLIANPTGRDRDWTVRLRFPGNVGALRTSWVESAPQATLRTEGEEFVWRSGVPVPAGGRVALRFHFSRSGSGDRPLSCTVDGTACAA